MANAMVRRGIVQWCEKVCARYHLSCLWLPDTDTYFIHKKGRAVMGFTGPQFMEIDPVMRAQHVAPMLRVGLAKNLEESTRHSLYTRYRQGKVIVP